MNARQILALVGLAVALLGAWKALQRAEREFDYRSG